MTDLEKKEKALQLRCLDDKRIYFLNNMLTKEQKREIYKSILLREEGIKNDTTFR